MRMRRKLDHVAWPFYLHFGDAIRRVCRHCKAAVSIRQKTCEKGMAVDYTHSSRMRV